MKMSRHSYTGEGTKSPTNCQPNRWAVARLGLGLEVGAMIKSPCNGICTLDGTGCYGCHRTLDEIGRWKYMTDEERQRVLDRLDRLDRLDSRS
jgi:predicted Fe-S protein YdhL (DUF1289 family)